MREVKVGTMDIYVQKSSPPISSPLKPSPPSSIGWGSSTGESSTGARSTGAGSTGAGGVGSTGARSTGAGRDQRGLDQLEELGRLVQDQQEGE